MGKPWHILWPMLAALTSCDDTPWPVTTFDAPFPGRDRDLTDLLGDQLFLKRGADTLSLSIAASKDHNLIVDDATGDTLFMGKVSMFRGLCYLSQQVNDSSYWIHAVRIGDDEVRGLHSAWTQNMLVEQAVRSGGHPRLVKRVTDTEVRLHPDRKAMRVLFSSIIDSIRPDTILRSHGTHAAPGDGARQPDRIGPEDLELLSKVYPNPTTGELNIELQQEGGIGYRLTDQAGRTIMEGRSIGIRSSIDLREHPDGVYTLTLTDPLRGWKESVRIIKAR